MILFLSIFYDVGTTFKILFELRPYKIFYSHMYRQNRTIKQLNFHILPMYIYLLLMQRPNGFNQEKTTNHSPTLIQRTIQLKSHCIIASTSAEVIGALQH